MRFSVLFLSLAAPAFSAVIQQIITCDSGSGNGELGHFPEDVIRPQWESRNGLTLVPLNRTARSGLLDPIREEGLITGCKFIPCPLGKQTRLRPSPETGRGFVSSAIFQSAHKNSTSCLT